jgi:hypothetical protein
MGPCELAGEPQMRFESQLRMRRTIRRRMVIMGAYLSV